MDQAHISTHVLDTSKGIPVRDLSINLYKIIDNHWVSIDESKTSSNGRCMFLGKNTGQLLSAGRYKLSFNVAEYFVSNKMPFLYPSIEVIFEITNSQVNYHLPLLLNPFGYSTYRGS